MGRESDSPQLRGPRRPAGAPVGREQVRRAILDAAARLFATCGVGGTSLRDIADEADVKLGLIRRYVGSREELIDAVMTDLSRQVAQGVVDRPLDQQSFEKDSALGHWTTLLVYFSITGRDLGPTGEFNPVQALAQVAREAYGIDEEASRVRGAQILASALGWRLLEPYLIKAAGIEDVDIDWLHESLTELHRRIGAMNWEREPET